MRRAEVFSRNTRDFFVVILANLRFNSQSKPNWYVWELVYFPESPEHEHQKAA